MQTITYDLPKLLKLIKEDKFQIPQFQRPFRWRTIQVKLLFDSLIRGYPVGSLLVMGRNSDIPLKSRSIEATIISDDAEEAPETYSDLGDAKDGYLVLDGQQQITSVARVFLNADQKRSYYIDLKETLNTFSTGRDSDDDLPWIKSYNKSKKDTERKNDNRWVRADVILDAQKSSIFVSEYLEDSGDFDDISKSERRRKAARLGELFEVIRKYQIPIVVIDADVGIESVCRVFETINSTGTRLTTFDLAVARFFPKPDLRELLNIAREKHSALKEFEVDGDRILQVLALSVGYSSKRTPEPSRSGLLALQPTYVAQHWEQATLALQTAYQWVKGQGARIDTLPNSGIVVAIAGALFFKPQIFEAVGLNFSSTLRRWYFSRVLREGASGGANTKIASDFSDIMDHLDEGTDLVFPNVLLTVNNIVHLTSAQDNRFKALQCVLAIHATEDLLTQEAITSESLIEHHHIFPRSFAKKLAWGSRVDSIANLIAISKTTNRTISDREPEDYLGKLNEQAIKNGTVLDLRRRLEKSLMPFTDRIGTSEWNMHLSLNAFENFLQARASILHHKIAELIGSSLVDKEASDSDGEPEAAEKSTS